MYHYRTSAPLNAPLFVSALALLAAAGGGSTDDGLFPGDPATEDDGGGVEAGVDASEDASAPSEDGSDGEAGPGPCKTAADCNDGIACTVDICNQGTCSHLPGPNEGATACPALEYCEVGKGCVPAVPCASDAQCEVKFGHDVCKTNIRCDPKNAVCVFSMLDKDGDGRVPLVCGGDDCNDADNEIHGGAVEICDGKDNDCNGVVDDDAFCPGAAVCQAGQCDCPPVNQCGTECVDKSQDPKHCGGCNKACEAGTSCQGGQCVCPASSLTCNGVCVDPETNRQHCGTCNKACGFAQSCENGTCTQAECDAPALYLLLDQSGSMTGTSWTLAKSGVSAFMAQSKSAGLQFGLGLFPPSSSANACSASVYQSPTVPIGTLPAHTSAIEAKFGDSPYGGSSHLRFPLEGAANYARSFAEGNTNSKTAIVIIFDGAPNECSGDSAATATSVTGQTYAASPSIPTYVIGVGSDAKNNPAIWNGVAQAGGTNAAFIVESAAAMTAALEAIRDEMAACP